MKRIDFAQDPEVVATFREEAEGRVFELEQGVRRLRSPGAGDAGSLIGPLFRSAHSLKAGANLLGFSEMERAAHLMENTLEQMRKGELAPDAAVLDQLIESLDRIGFMLDEMRR